METELKSEIQSSLGNPSEELGDGVGTPALAVQAWVPEWEAPRSHVKPGVAVPAYSLSPG